MRGRCCNCNNMAPHRDSDSNITNGQGMGAPRFTVFMRAYGDASLTNGMEADNEDVTAILARKREEKRQLVRRSGLTWSRLKAEVEKLGQKFGLKLDCYLREVWEVARLVAPEPDTREEAAILLFQVSHDHAVPTLHQNQKLRRMFGDVKQHTLARAHKAVRSIADVTSEEELVEMMQQLSTPERDPPMFGTKIKLGLRRPTTCDEFPYHSLLNLKKAKEESRASLLYDGYAPEPLEKETKVKVSKEIYDRSWIEAEMLKYYSDTSIISELSNSTMTLLCSPKADDELQNELFDLLGFERFELIQSLLKQRSVIKNPSPNKQQKINALLNGLAGQSGREHPTFGQSVTIMNEMEKQLLKQARKEEKKLFKAAKQLAEEDAPDDFSPETLRAK
ncbi:hypothetical protein SK128_002440, partial [Halocaridina rubra]